MQTKKYIVYILKSLTSQGRHCVGFTDDLTRRLKEHNEGLSAHTKDRGPWQVETYVVFNTQKHTAV